MSLFWSLILLLFAGIIIIGSAIFVFFKKFHKSSVDDAAEDEIISETPELSDEEKDDWLHKLGNKLESDAATRKQTEFENVWQTNANKWDIRLGDNGSEHEAAEELGKVVRNNINVSGFWEEQLSPWMRKMVEDVLTTGNPSNQRLLRVVMHGVAEKIVPVLEMEKLFIQYLNSDLEGRRSLLESMKNVNEQKINAFKDINASQVLIQETIGALFNDYLIWYAENKMLPHESEMQDILKNRGNMLAKILAEKLYSSDDTPNTLLKKVMNKISSHWNQNMKQFIDGQDFRLLQFIWNQMSIQIDSDATDAFKEINSVINEVMKAKRESQSSDLVQNIAEDSQKLLRLGYFLYKVNSGVSDINQRDTKDAEQILGKMLDICSKSQKITCEYILEDTLPKLFFDRKLWNNQTARFLTMFDIINGLIKKLDNRDPGKLEILVKICNEYAEYDDTWGIQQFKEHIEGLKKYLIDRGVNNNKFDEYELAPRKKIEFVPSDALKLLKKPYLKKQILKRKYDIAAKERFRKRIEEAEKAEKQIDEQPPPQPQKLTWKQKMKTKKNLWQDKLAHKITKKKADKIQKNLDSTLSVLRYKMHNR